MKRVLTAALAMSLTIGMVGCAGAASAANQGKAEGKTASAETKDSAKKEKTEKKQEDKPADLPAAEQPYERAISKEDVQEMTDEEVQSRAKEMGYDEVTKNADGSYTLSMNVETTNKKIKEVKSQMDEAIKEIKSGKEAVKEVKDIAVNDYSKEMKITVEKDQLSQEDEHHLSSLTVGMSAIQRLLGKEDKDVDAKVHFVDSKTNQIIKTVTYQDLIANSEQ